MRGEHVADSSNSGVTEARQPASDVILGERASPCLREGKLSGVCPTMCAMAFQNFGFLMIKLIRWKSRHQHLQVAKYFLFWKT